MTDAMVVREWLDANGIQFVNRSYGQYTTGPVSLDSLERLVARARDQATAHAGEDMPAEQERTR